MFDLTQLRCFVTVAEELHFGHAAALLNMSQPPLSRQIQALEHIVEVKLLDRTSRSVRLTAAGKCFLPEARHILKLAESATELVRRIARVKPGALKIGFIAETAYSFLPRLVIKCGKRLPEMDLSLNEMMSGDQFDAIASGQIDAGFLRAPIVRAELMSMRVVAEPLLAASPSGLILEQAESISLKDLDGQPFIMYSRHESRYFYDLLVALFLEADVLPRYVQTLSQILSMLAMVRAGLGLAIVPAAAANLRFEGVYLSPLIIQNPLPAELFMAWRRDNENPMLPKLIEIASSLAAAERRAA